MQTAASCARAVVEAARIDQPLPVNLRPQLGGDVLGPVASAIDLLLVSCRAAAGRDAVVIPRFVNVKAACGGCAVVDEHVGGGFQ